MFKAHVAKAGMDPASFTFHGLRHSAATLMLVLGVPVKVVAEALGHSRVGLTPDVYSHVLPAPAGGGRRQDGRAPGSTAKGLGYSLGYSPVRNRR